MATRGLLRFAACLSALHLAAAVVLQQRSVNKTQPPSSPQQRPQKASHANLTAAAADASAASGITALANANLTHLQNSTASTGGQQSPCYAFSPGSCNRACCQCKESRGKAPSTQRALGMEYFCCFSYYQNNQCEAGAVVVGSGIATPCPGMQVGINCYDGRF
eukprot:TRINITY_DN122467_c0_g1_i1.p2 TRINITY_DN122467_c0_g1~~TRINITY_DN122467_c0_g1_i1.p2  ORF type:complete len:163 (+),score=32.62 TRINITY_DN122467_c0_g1_i1:58-546(+)